MTSKNTIMVIAIFLLMCSINFVHRVEEGSTRVAEKLTQALSQSPDPTIINKKCQSNLHSGYISDAAFSNDGRYFLTASGDKTFRLWDMESGQLIRCFDEHKDLVSSVVFSSDNKMILSGSADNMAILWDTQNKKILQRFLNPTHVNSVALSSNGRRAISAAFKTIYMWDTETGKEIHRLIGHTHIIRSIIFSPNDKYVLSGGYDGTVRLWDTETGKEIRQFKVQDWFDHVVFSPDGTKVLAAGSFASHLWNVEDGKEILTFNRSTHLAFSSKGNCIIVGIATPGKKGAPPPSEDNIAPIKNTLYLFDIENKRISHKFDTYDSMVGASFISEDKLAISVSKHGHVRYWNIATGKELISFNVGPEFFDVP